MLVSACYKELIQAAQAYDVFTDGVFELLLLEDVEPVCIHEDERTRQLRWFSANFYGKTVRVRWKTALSLLSLRLIKQLLRTAEPKRIAPLLSKNGILKSSYAGGYLCTEFLQTSRCGAASWPRISGILAVEHCFWDRRRKSGSCTSTLLERLCLPAFIILYPLNHAADCSPLEILPMRHFIFNGQLSAALYPA